MRHYFSVTFQDRYVDSVATIEPLSVGISCDDGREFYAVNMDADWVAANDNYALKRYVIPQLGGAQHYMRAADIRTGLYEFLRPTHADDPTELWGWYTPLKYAALFALLIGGDMPDYIPHWANDVRQVARSHHDPVLPPQVNGEHHALGDARHAMFLHKFLEALAK